jgi:signal transduction histidine kinase
MRDRFTDLASSGIVSRLAIGGMLLAIGALGALAVWANVVAHGHVRDLSRAGVQTTGHLRATQALGQIDNYSDILEDGIDPKVLAQLRSAEQVLRESLARMQRESVVEWERQLARDAEPDVRDLAPAINAFVDSVGRVDEEDQGLIEDELQIILDRVQLKFNDIRRDPSRLLQEETEAAASGNRTVDRAAIVLIPLALLFVGLCAWLLTTSRKQAEAERKRMEAELRLSQRLEAVGHLAAGVAHEINTPMQFVGDSVGFVNESFGAARARRRIQGDLRRAGGRSRRRAGDPRADPRSRGPR